MSYKVSCDVSEKWDKVTCLCEKVLSDVQIWLFTCNVMCIHQQESEWEGFGTLSIVTEAKPRFTFDKCSKPQPRPSRYFCWCIKINIKTAGF